MAKQKRRINHGRRILSEKTMHTGNLLPGMIIRFTYTTPKVYDRRPLALFLYREDDLFHCINFNYLHEYKVQELFNWSVRVFEGRITEAFKEENFYNLRSEFTRIGFTNKLAPSDVSADEFYHRVIKSRYLNTQATKDCYRTFKEEHISALKIVSYDIDVWRDFKQTGKFDLFGENIDVEEAGEGPTKYEPKKRT